MTIQSTDSPFTRGPARRPESPAPRNVPPTTADDAERRFYRRYGPQLVAALLGTEVAQPTTVEEWIALAEAVRDVLTARTEAQAKVKRT